MNSRLYLFSILLIALSSCVEDMAPERIESQTRGVKDDEVFYYYGIEDKKIIVNKVPDKMFVKYTSPEKQSQVVDAGDVMSFKSDKEVVSMTNLLECNGSEFAITDEFIVKLKSGTSYEMLQKFAEQNDCVIGKENEFVKNQYMLYVPKSSELNAMQMANRFYETGLFEFSEPNIVDLNATQSTDQYFDQQWGLQNNYMPTIDIDAEQAWVVTKGSPSIKIAVIDTGVELNHPDLQGNLLSGYDATGRGTNGGPYYDTDKHGTSVAGIIGAIQNTIGISGVAPNCKIIPVKVGTDTGGFPRDQSSNGINWARQNGADIINCSFGSQNAPTSNLTNAIVNACTNGRGGKGCVVVVSSGNDNGLPVSYPATIGSTIAVGAIDNSGKRASFSNYGNELDVVAPGVYIYSTDRVGALGYSPDDYTYDFEGTSAATPFVSGVAALILSVKPNFTSAQTTDIIEQSARELSNYNVDQHRAKSPWNSQVGYGLVNAYDALMVAMYGLQITGPQNHAFTQQATYTVPGSLPTGVRFNGWSINPNIDVTATGMNTPTLKVTFNDALIYTIYANFSLPNGKTYSATKTLNYSPSFVRPILAIRKQNPTAVTGTATMYVTNPGPPGVNYEWRRHVGYPEVFMYGVDTEWTYEYDNRIRHVGIQCRVVYGSSYSAWSSTMVTSVVGLF